MNGPQKPDREPEESWLDEISLSTKIVFLVTFGSVALLAILYLVDLFF